MNNLFSVKIPEFSQPKTPIKLKQKAAQPLLKIEKMRENKDHYKTPRNLEEILADIQTEQTEKITQLEWVYCLYQKPEWDRHNPDLALATSEVIWQVALSNILLKNRLLWRLSLYHSNPELFADILADSLIKTFPSFANKARGNDTFAVQIIKAMTENETAKILAKLSWQYTITPQELVERSLLPASLPQIEEAYNYLAGIFPPGSTPNKQEADWILRCLQEMSPHRQLTAVQELLTKISPEVAVKMPKVLDYLQENYGSNKKLSKQAKQTLNKCLGAVNYTKLEEVLNLLSRMLKLEDSERTKIEEIRDFWANYSDKIKRIQFLLPQSSINTLGYQLQINVGVLTEAGSVVTEVCILALEDWFAIEFLRGQGSELRLIPKSKQNQDLLFGKSRLSVPRLRSLGGEINDHVYLWQPYCEKFLRSKDIVPNEGIENFKGLPPETARYSRQNGLKIPEDKKQIKQRENLLKAWQKEIEKLEKY